MRDDLRTFDVSQVDSPILLHLFKKMQPLAFLLLPLYAVGLHVHAFLYPINSQLGGGLAYDCLYVGSWAPWWVSPVVTLVAVCACAFILIAICSEYRVTRRPTALPGLCFVLLTAASPQLLVMTPGLLLVGLLLLIINTLLSSVKKQNLRGAMYASGLWSGVSILSLANMVVLPAVLLLAIPRLRRLSIREILIFLIGVSVPFWLVWVYFVWSDQPFGLVDLFAGLVDFRLPEDVFALNFLVPLLIFGFALLLVFGLYGTMTSKREMSDRKQLDWFLMLSIGLLAAACFGAVGRVDLLLVLAVPLSVLLADAFLNIRSMALSEVVHVILLFGVLFSQYSDILLS